MTIKIIAAAIATLSCLHLGCASDTGPEIEITTSGPVIPKHIDIKAKQKYVQNVKASLKLYSQVIMDIKYYHDRRNYKELAGEIDKYVKIYVKGILLDSELNGSLDTRVEIAKIHLFVISMYLDIDYHDRAWEYLKLFRTQYESDKYLLDMTLNSGDIDYPTLGTGMRELEARAIHEGQQFVHGIMFPRRQIPKRSIQEQR
jgi:hypothetical protein